MKINYSVLLAGAGLGGALAWYYMHKTQVPNAFAMGQANPTVAFSNLNKAQLSQLNTSPVLQSPPSIATLAGSAIPGVNSPMPSVGTGALLGRRRLMPIRYRGMGRHG